MASKRPQVTFPDLDDMQPKGRHAILRSAEEIAAEQALLESQEAGEPETRNASIQENSVSGVPENQNTGIQVNQYSAKPEYQTSSNQDTRTSRKPVSKKTSQPAIQQSRNRAEYPKVTYRLSYEAIDAVEDMKRLLRRQYGVKVNLEEIAEEAILAAYADLLGKQKSSNLVIKFSGNPEKKK